ncbi:MAG: DoxX family protein [Bacteroidota bacterium]
MKEKIVKYLPWGIRIFMFLMFMISAVTKMFPIWAFEKQFVDLGIASWCWAPFFARFMIAVEIALGIAIIQPHFLKRLVIPATILLLTVFCVHLSIQMVQFGAMTGNCGCFGQILPMTPLEAFLKNIVFIALLVFLYKKVKDKEKGQNKFVYLIVIGLASILVMFILFPFCPCNSSTLDKQNENIVDTTFQQSNLSDSTVTKSVSTTQEEVSKNNNKLATETTETVGETGPQKTKSKFSQFTNFGNKKVNLDDGRKIICLFAPGCDHCVEAAKEIVLLSKTMYLPEVYILFMNEEVNKIPDFFKQANSNFPYRIIEIPLFWDLMGMSANTPGVFYLWNGNVIKFFEGADANKFNPEELKKVL